MTRLLLAMVLLGLISVPVAADTSAHGLNERLPVKAFYEGLDHLYRLSVDLGQAQRAK